MENKDKVNGAYWLNPRDKPHLYNDKLERSKYLYRILERKTNNLRYGILELGCNLGRNLQYLYTMGYKPPLVGVDINPESIKIARDQCNRDITFFVSSLQDFINKKSLCFNTVVSMAVLMHVPRDEDVQLLKNIPCNYLVTIEDEIRDSFNHTPRNYRKFFKESFEQIYMMFPPRRVFPRGYITRVFRAK